MFSRLPRDEALEKEDRIDEMKNIKSNPPIQHLLQAQQAVCFAFDMVGKWRPMIKKQKKKTKKKTATTILMTLKNVMDKLTFV